MSGNYLLTKLLLCDLCKMASRLADRMAFLQVEYDKPVKIMLHITACPNQQHVNINLQLIYIFTETVVCSNTVKSISNNIKTC